LTTIDTGTRVYRFILQEFVGRAWKPFGKTDWLPGTILSTTAIVFAWATLIWQGSISTIWPMFGTANQLLAGVALAVASSAIINAGRVRYVWVTLIPMLFVTVTTLIGCYLNIVDNFYPLTLKPGMSTQDWVNIILTMRIMFCAIVIMFEAFRRWYRVLVKRQYSIAGKEVYAGDANFSPPEFGCC